MMGCPFTTGTFINRAFQWSMKGGGKKCFCYILPLCFHVGRHSFASLITLEEGVPIETISRMLGHTNIQTTQIYARVTPKKLFEDMDRFVEATKDLELVL